MSRRSPRSIVPAPVSLESTLARIPLSAPRVSEPPVSLLSSGERWTAIRLEHLHTPPGELGEGYLSAHLVALLLSGPQMLQLMPAGGGWVSYRVEAGSVQVIPAFLVHRVRWSAPAEWIGLLVEPAFLQAVAGDGTVDLRARFGVDDALLRQLLLALRDEVRDGGRGGKPYAEQLGGAVAARLARNYGAHGGGLPRPGGLPAGKLRSVIRYIHAHLEDELLLPALADLLRMNVHSFPRAVRPRPHDRVARIVVTATAPAFEGKVFGNVGAFDKLVVTAFGEVDPREPRNAIIQDIELAPRNARGMVEYSADLYLIKPHDMTKGNRILFYNVHNRGNKGGLNTFNLGVQGTADCGQNDPVSAGDGFLQNAGFTI